MKSERDASRRKEYKFPGCFYLWAQVQGCLRLCGAEEKQSETCKLQLQHFIVHRFCFWMNSKNRKCLRAACISLFHTCDTNPSCETTDSPHHTKPYPDPHSDLCWWSSKAAAERYWLQTLTIKQNQWNWCWRFSPASGAAVRLHDHSAHHTVTNIMVSKLLIPTQSVINKMYTQSL